MSGKPKIDWSIDGDLIKSLYSNNYSTCDIELYFNCKYTRGSIKQFLKRNGLLRSFSDAQVLAIKLGKKDETTRKLIESTKTQESRKRMSEIGKLKVGEKSNSWVKDRSLVGNSRRRSEEINFIKKILDDRNYICELTKEKCNKLSVHHIKPVYLFPEFRYDPNNVILIKRIIHRHFHRLYGTRCTELDWTIYTRDLEWKKATEEENWITVYSSL